MYMMNRLYSLIARNLYTDKLPKRLRINGREKLPISTFNEDDKLFRAYCKTDIDELTKKIKLETIRFPDLSCNWSRIAKALDIWYRENGKISDGCYSITVKDARYNNIATTVHDILIEPIENYSHIEIRQLKDGESVFSEPPKERKLDSKTCHKKRVEYRNYIQKKYHIEIYAK